MLSDTTRACYAHTVDGDHSWEVAYDDALGREACTDDELSDGTCDPELLYVNPLWKLQLARSRYPRYRIGRPMQILLRLLGTPLETPLKK